MTATVSPGRRQLASPVAAWLLVALIVVLVAAFAVLSVAAREMTAGGFWSTVLVVVPVAAVGLVVAARRPGNPIGWSCLGMAVLTMAGAGGGEYAVLTYRMGEHLPGGPAALLLALYWAPVLAAFPVMILIFPDGKLPSRRWRWVLWAYLAVAAAWPVSVYAVAIRAIAEHDIHVIPGGDLRAVDFPAGSSGWLSGVETAVLPALAVFWALFVLRQVLSWRRAGGERRQQLKWLLLGAAVCMACTAWVVVGSTLDPNAGPALQAATGVVSLGIAALPVGMGVAILRYRLWDIDRIISRTVSYAIVTGLLVGVYAGLVILVTQVLGVRTPVAVAVATLAAVALFNPLRRRVQRLVDRRFNRARYDAERTVVAFSARLRGAPDLDVVRGDLLDVVARSLQPAHASLWLRDGTP